MNVEPLPGFEFLSRVFDLVRTSSLGDLVTEAELQTGLRSIALGLLPIAAELIQARASGEDLADIVYAPTRFPHVTAAHGLLHNLLVMPLPEAVLPTCRGFIAAGPPPGVEVLRSALVVMAAKDSSPIKRDLARLALFEALCWNQRLVLRQQGVHLEALDGRRTDVEVIAQREVEMLLDGDPRYRDEVLALEDPLASLVPIALAGLDQHVETLRDGLRSLRAEYQDVLERRRRLLDIMERLPPDEAALLFNETAQEFGEERYGANELQILNPGLFRNLSRDALYKRVERLPKRVERLSSPHALQRRSSSWLDLLAEAMEQTA